MFLRYTRSERAHNALLSKRVLHQFRYEHTICWPPSPFEGGVVVVLDDRWFHFTNHIATIVVLASHFVAYTIGYTRWIRSVSHPYVPFREDKDRQYVASSTT